MGGFPIIIHNQPQPEITSTRNEPTTSKTWWHADTTRFIPLGIIFEALVSFTNSGIDSIRCHQPVPRRRVSIRPKPPRFRESKLPVHHAAIGDLVTCVALTVFELQKIDYQDLVKVSDWQLLHNIFVYQKFLKVRLEMNLCCFKRFPSHDFGSTEHRSAVSSQLTRWKRRSKAASFSMCLVYLERFPVLVCPGNDGPTVPPTNKMADALYAYKIRFETNI